MDMLMDDGLTINSFCYSILCICSIFRTNLILRIEIIFPFHINMVNSIIKECKDNTDDTEAVYAACEIVLGINPYINQY